MAPAYYMLSCAHPTHFRDQLDTGADWAGRVQGIRANASRLSHAELDAATDLDRGDIAELAELYAWMHSRLDLRVVGGCCGTDSEHVASIASATGTGASARTGGERAVTRSAPDDPPRRRPIASTR
jgi:S-methylmethionine-dependent homocysteine/selenocysteine methylase